MVTYAGLLLVKMDFMGTAQVFLSFWTRGKT